MKRSDGTHILALFKLLLDGRALGGQQGSHIRSHILAGFFHIIEQEPGAEKADHDAGRSDFKQELAALAVHQHHGDNSHQAVHDLDGKVCPVGGGAFQACLLKYLHGIIQHGINARSLRKRQNEHRQNKGIDILALKKGLAGRTLLFEFLRLLLLFLFNMNHFIKHFLGAGIPVTAHQHSQGFILAAAAEQVAGRFAQTEGTEKQEQAGNGANPENSLPGQNLGGSQRFFARAGILDAAHITGGKQTDDGGKHQAHRQQELEHPRSLAAGLGAQALGQIQRNDHAHNTGTGALKNTAQQHNAEYFLGQADHGDARRE